MDDPHHAIKGARTYAAGGSSHVKQGARLGVKPRRCVHVPSWELNSFHFQNICSSAKAVGPFFIVTVCQEKVIP